MKKNPSTNFFTFAYAVLIVGLISTPLITALFSEVKTTSTSEKRMLATWVSWQQAKSPTDYFTHVSSYAQDHFGFRDELISLNAKILFALNQSPVDKVIKGKEGWLFYKTYDALSLLSSDKSAIISAIERRARHVSYRADTLKARGIAYVYVIAPNKMVMYREKMPKVYALSENNHMQDLFTQSLDQSKLSFYFDLKKYLKEQQSKALEFDFYYKNDTHWNHFGAYAAYNGVVDFIKQSHPKVELSPAEYSFSEKEKIGGDLAKFIGLNEHSMAKEPSTFFSDCAAYANIKAVRKGLLKGQCNTNGTKALLIGDSFRTNLYPFVTQSVGTLYVANQGINHKQLDEIIKEIQPDLVIEEMVQRNLGKELPY